MQRLHSDPLCSRTQTEFLVSCSSLSVCGDERNELSVKTKESGEETLLFRNGSPLLSKKRWTDPHGEERKRNKTAMKVLFHESFSLLFYFFSSLRRGDQSTVFCIVSFDFNCLQRSGTRLNWFVVVVLPILEDFSLLHY